MFHGPNRLIRSLVLCCLAVAPFAAEPAGAPTGSATKAPLVEWRTGDGTIAGAAAEAGMTATVGQRLVAGDQTVRLALSQAPQAQLVLAPGARIRLSEQEGACLIWLDEGAVQFDIADRGPYRQIVVVGAATLVRVTGTLFVVERDTEGQDFVALISGKLKVNLRDEVRRRLAGAGPGEIELASRQSLGASARAGFGTVQELSSRPQIPLTTNAAGVRQQAESGLGTDWTTDLANRATTPEAPPEPPTPTLVQDTIGNQVSNEVTDTITRDITETVNEQVQDQVVRDTAVPELPGPPARP